MLYYVTQVPRRLVEPDKRGFSYHVDVEPLPNGTALSFRIGSYGSGAVGVGHIEPVALTSERREELVRRDLESLGVPGREAGRATVAEVTLAETTIGWLGRSPWVEGRQLAGTDLLGMPEVLGLLYTGTEDAPPMEERVVPTSDRPVGLCAHAQGLSLSLAEEVAPLLLHGVRRSDPLPDCYVVVGDARFGRDAGDVLASALRLTSRVPGRRITRLDALPLGLHRLQAMLLHLQGAVLEVRAPRRTLRRDPEVAQAAFAQWSTVVGCGGLRTPLIVHVEDPASAMDVVAWLHGLQVALIQEGA